MSSLAGSIARRPHDPRDGRRLTVVRQVDARPGMDEGEFPSELALLLRVALPLRSQRRRQAAAGYAIEDQIAEPLESCHIVVGPSLGGDEYLVVVVRKTEMRKWIALAGGRGRLVPDVLFLPVPAEASLSVREEGGRILARRPDGTGFVTRAETFGTFWRADGSPRIVLFGGTLPAGLPASAGAAPLGEPAVGALQANLLQGEFAPGNGGATLARRFAAVATLALLAHGTIFAAETHALNGIARERQAAVRAALAARLPELPASTPLDVALRTALPTRRSAGGGLLPLLDEVAEALRPVGQEITLRDLRFDAAERGLALTVEATDLGTLQRAENALGAAGLSVASGVATTANGGAEVNFTIRAGGAT